MESNLHPLFDTILRASLQPPLAAEIDRLRAQIALIVSLS